MSPPQAVLNQSPVYLDYAATTPVDLRVAEAMGRCLTSDGVYGNPASSHLPGRSAAQWVERARAQVAELIKASPQEIVWTSGATEANNLAIKGAAWFQRARGRGAHLITVRSEHKSVLKAFERLTEEGFEVDYLPVDEQGRVSAADLATVLRDDTTLVSVMHANNETGTVQDLQTLAQQVKARGALLHVDAVQSAGRLPLDVASLPVDLLSLSAHKLYGPKGIGALYVRRRPRVRLSPLLDGGGQEGGLRPGTVPTHQVVGMGAAYALAAAEMATDMAHLQHLRARLWQGLESLDGVVRNGEADGAPHIVNVSFIGVQGEALVAALPAQLAVATSSACSADSGAPSHVLRAMGRADALAHASLRLSFGRFSTEHDIDYAVQSVAAAVRRLRAFSPVWRAYREGRSLATLYGMA